MRNLLLLLALHFGMYRLASFLIKVGADVNACWYNGTNLALIAILQKNKEKLIFLCNKGVDLYHVYSNGWSPIYYVLAFHQEDPDFLKIILDRIKFPLEIKNGDFLALETARKNNDHELFDDILRRGADPNCFHDYAQDGTLLAELVFAGEYSLATKLIKAGAVPNHADKEYCDALACIGSRESSEKEGSREFLLLLLRSGYHISNEPKAISNQMALHHYVSVGDVEVVQACIFAGADLNFRIFGHSLFYVAKTPEMAEILTPLVDINYEEGRRILINALLMSNYALAKKLVELKVGTASDETSCETFSWSPLMLAITRKQTDLVEKLIKSGSNVNFIEDSRGNTPLILAAQSGHLVIFEMLLQAGADPNIATNNGWTALMGAVRTGDFDMVESLLRTGAEANAQYEDFSAIELAEEQNYPRIVEILREYRGY